MSFENWRSPVHLILVIIFALLSPSLVGLTRINDNFHHPHDVIFGIILGGIIAIIVVSFLCTMKKISRLLFLSYHMCRFIIFCIISIDSKTILSLGIRRALLLVKKMIPIMKL